MDVKEKRRFDHLKRLEANHGTDFAERFETEKTRKQIRDEEVKNAISADWNRKRKAARSAKTPLAGQILPEGWRDEHWKTLQVMASDYAGVEAKKKADAVAALEAYEASLKGE